MTTRSMPILTVCCLAAQLSPLWGVTNNVRGIDIIYKKKPAGSIIAQTQTDSSGVYRIQSLPAGDYQLEATSANWNQLAPCGGDGPPVQQTTQVNNSRSNIKNNAAGPRPAALASGPSVTNGQLLFSGTLCQGLVITQDFTLSDTADLAGVFTSDDVILSTTALSFRAVVGGPAPAAQTLDISATGSSAVSYTAASWEGPPQPRRRSTS